MSKKALYRQNVAFTQAYSYIKDGEPVTVFVPIVWTKGNLQPFKQGIITNISDVGTIFKDWRVLYTKTHPVFDTTNIPTDADAGITYFYYDGVWYSVNGEQDWSIQARNVKHFKWLAVHVQNASLPPALVEPVPYSRLVESFEKVVSELDQVNDTIHNVIEQ